MLVQLILKHDGCSDDEHGALGRLVVVAGLRLAVWVLERQLLAGGQVQRGSQRLLLAFAQAGDRAVELPGQEGGDFFRFAQLLRDLADDASQLLNAAACPACALRSRAILLCAQGINQLAVGKLFFCLQAVGVANGDGAIGEVIAQPAVGVFEGFGFFGGGCALLGFQRDFDFVEVDLDIQPLAAGLLAFGFGVQLLRAQFFGEPGVERGFVGGHGQEPDCPTCAAHSATRIVFFPHAPCPSDFIPHKALNKNATRT